MNRVFALTILVACAGAVVSAKGTTTRISIAGANLERPIDITDNAVVEQFNVWSGPGTSSDGVPGTEGFIADWSAPVVHEGATGARRYEISFFTRFRENAGEQLAYIVDYDYNQADAFVFIPDRPDPRFALNV